MSSITLSLSLYDENLPRREEEEEEEGDGSRRSINGAMKNWRQQLDRPVCMDRVFNFTDLFGLRTGSENRTLTDETAKITELKAQWVFQNDLYIHGFIIVIFNYD